MEQLSLETFFFSVLTIARIFKSPMKYSTLALFATAVVAAEETFNLRVVSENTEVDGKGISPVREGAGINFYLLEAEVGPEFHYNAEEARLYQYDGDDQANVGADAGFLQGGRAVEPSEVTFNDEGVLKIAEQLWACKELNDPSQHFVEDYGVAAADEAPNDTCHKISLQRDDGGKEEPAPSHDGWNQTTTKQVTVTGYTTYCPEPTTLTVTTCVEKECAPKEVTVSEPKTVTITEECLVDKTTTPQPSKVEPTEKPKETEPKETTPKETKPKETAPKETAPKETEPKETAPKETETKPSSVAAPSTSASVTSFEGAAVKNAAGFVAGVAGVAALLI